MQLGIGLGLGFRSNVHQPLAAPPNREMLVKAIAELRHVSAKYRGARIIFEPYAVFRPEAGEEIVTALVKRSGKALPKEWGPQYLALHALTDVEVLETVFLVDDAFCIDDPAYSSGSFVCRVDPVESVHNGE